MLEDEKMGCEYLGWSSFRFHVQLHDQIQPSISSIYLHICGKQKSLFTLLLVQISQGAGAYLGTHGHLDMSPIKCLLAMN